jgi:hypothetical protein
MPKFLSELPEKEPVVFFFDRLGSRDVDEETILILNSGDGNTRRSSLEIDGDVLIWVGPGVFDEVFGGKGALIQEIDREVLLLAVLQASLEVLFLRQPSPLQVHRRHRSSQHHFFALDLSLPVNPPQPMLLDPDLESSFDVSASLTN